MAVGGENIGRAYIKILADGKGLDKAIRDDLDDIDWDKNSRTAANKWAEGWRKEFEKSHNQSKLQEAIAKPLTRGDYLTRTYFRGQAWRNFRSGLQKEYGDAGSRAGEALERNLIEGIDIRGHLKNMTPLIKKMEQEIARDSASNTRRIYQTRLRIEEHFQAQEKENLRELRKDYQKFTISMKDALDPSLKLTHSHRDLVKEHRRLRLEMEKTGLVTPRINRDFDDMNRRLIRMHPGLDRVNHGISLFSDGVGVGFGRGSRNNFLNFIGSVARNVTRLPMLFTNAAGSLLSWTRGISSATGGVGKLKAAFGPLAKSGAAVIAALAGIALIIGPLIGVFSMAIGVVTALSSTILYGLVGAVSALAGALIPAAAGIGVFVLALFNMPKVAKRAFSDIGKSFRGLGKIAAEGVFSNITRQAERFKQVASGFEPVTRRIGFAISRIGDYWLDMMQGPGFRAFRQSMESFIPGAVEKLGHIFGNVFGGLGGILRGMVPLLNRFLNWFEDVTKRFSNWANSAKGQNSIRKFFDDAGDSASKLGGFLKSVAKLLGTVLSAGRGTGDSLFGSMTKAVDRWNSALQKNPDALRQWFDDAKKFGQELGNIVLAVGHLVDALDSPGTRLLGRVLFGPMVLSLNLLAESINIVHRSWGAFLVMVGEGMNLIDKLTLGGNPFKGQGDDLIKAGRGMMELKSSADATRGSLGSIASTLDQVTGAATHATRALALQKLRQQGVVQASNQMGVSTRDLISASLGQRGALDRVNAALARNPGLAAKVGPILRKMGIDFKVAGDKTRLAAREANQWADAVNNLPRSKMMKVSAQGMPKTLGQFKQLVRDIKLTPKQVRTLVKASGVPVTKKQLNDLIRIAKDFGKQKPTAKPNVNPKPAKSHFAALMKLSGLFDRQKPKPTANVNATPAMNALGKVIGKVRETDRQRATPQVRINADLSGAYAAQRLLASLHDKSLTITTHMNQVRSATGRIAPGGVGERVKMAFGGIVRSTTNTANGFQIGEAGAEAIVPLHRPLGQVDPAVRWLSAIAQGITPLARGGVIGGGRTVNVGGITVNSPSADPRMVALQTVNELVGKAY